MSGFLWVPLAVGAWWLVRNAVARRAERQFEQAYRRSPDGVIIGAESIRLSGTRAGAILLIHGYNDSPQSVASMAAALNARGWTVWAPLLPGHGRTLQAFGASRAEEWIRASREALAQLRASHDRVAVGGLSMGGAIAFILAAEHPDVVAVLAFAPYVHASVPLRLLDAVAPVAALGARYLSSGGARSVHDPVAGEQMIAYRRSTPGLLAQLDRVVRAASASLPSVRQPVLFVQSRQDNRIPVSSAASAFEKIGSTDKTLHWVQETGHVLTVDYGHEALERLTADWLEDRLP